MNTDDSGRPALRPRLRAGRQDVRTAAVPAGDPLRPPPLSGEPSSSSFSGHLHLRAARRPHGRTVLDAQSFRAPFHLSKPYWDAEAGALLVQVVNPTAGVLAGDRLESSIAVDPDAALLVTTPSASRIFQMRGGAAECRQSFSVAAGGWLEVLPEPLVPHRGSRFRQETIVEVAAGGGLFYVDQLMPGRLGHGEAWAWDRLELILRVRSGPDLVLHERFHHTGAALRDLAVLAGSGAHACFAQGVLIAPDDAEPSGSAASWGKELAALHGGGLWLGVSKLHRRGWSVKLIASDAVSLRRGLRAVRATLARYFPRLACATRKL